VVARVVAGDYRWQLAGRPLGVKDHYQYLGVELSNCTSESRKRLQKWQRAIGRFMLLAKQRSYETLHLCASHGKHAAAPAVLFSLWRSLVRPLLEIGSELWSPEIGKVDKDKIEKLQYKFARRATSLPDSTPLPFLRGEMGLPSLGGHHDELAVRFFGRLTCAPQHRLLSHVFRTRLLQAHEGKAERSWCTAIHSVLTRYGFEEQWKSGDVGKLDDWPRVVRDAVNTHETVEWRRGCVELSSLTIYRTPKSAIAVDPWMKVFQDKQPRHLMLHARAGMLDLLPRLASIVGVSDEERAAFSQCKCCTAGEQETLQHLLLKCIAFRGFRDDMYNRIQEQLRELKADPLHKFLVASYTSDDDRLAVLLGSSLPERSHSLRKALRKLLCRADCRVVINRVVSNYLMLVWRDRERILGYPVVKYDRSLKRNVLTDWVRREYGKATERAAAAGEKPCVLVEQDTD
jgi:hypothetical protein